jgi:methionyl-tRNA synthetase
MTRVDPKQIDALVEANKESLAPAPEAAAPQKHAEKQEKAAAVPCASRPKAAGGSPHISIDDFMKVDLRIARSSMPATSKAPTS